MFDRVVFKMLIRVLQKYFIKFEMINIWRGWNVEIKNCFKFVGCGHW